MVELGEESCGFVSFSLLEGFKMSWLLDETKKDRMIVVVC